jgi:hypothetical protein
MYDPGTETPIGLAPPTPGEDEATARRRLCLGAMAGAPGLLRYAARFAPSLEDAEDALCHGKLLEHQARNVPAKIALSCRTQTYPYAWSLG